MRMRDEEGVAAVKCQKVTRSDGGAIDLSPLLRFESRMRGTR